MLSQTLGEQLGIWIQTKSSMFRVLRPSALSASATTGSIRPKRLKSDSDRNTFQMNNSELESSVHAPPKAAPRCRTFRRSTIFPV